MASPGPGEESDDSRPGGRSDSQAAVGRFSFDSPARLSREFPQSFLIAQPLPRGFALVYRLKLIDLSGAHTRTPIRVDAGDFVDDGVSLELIFAENVHVPAIDAPSDQASVIDVEKLLELLPLKERCAGLHEVGEAERHVRVALRMCIADPGSRVERWLHDP